MKAVVRDSYGPPEILRLEDVDTPAAEGDRAVVRVHAASVNAADVDYLTGSPWITRFASGFGAPKNRVPGLDVAGRVEAVGPEVTGLRPGDAVWADLTDHGNGAFAEYVCAPASVFAPMPGNGVTFAEASTVPQSALLALHGLNGKGHHIAPGEKVLVNGGGGCVGPFAIQLAKARGAEVTAVDRGEKLDLMRSAGADRVIDYTREDYTEDHERYGLIVDVAAFRPIRHNLRCLTRTGVYMVVGGKTVRVIQSTLAGPWLSLTGRKKKMGTPPWKPNDRTGLATMKELLEAGTVRPLIDRRYTLEQVPEALRHQADGHTRGKLVIDIFDADGTAASA